MNINLMKIISKIIVRSCKEHVNHFKAEIHKKSCVFLSRVCFV